jgi:peptidoglycan hydrolase-like protein with peptidoglycan-binding domain
VVGPKTRAKLNELLESNDEMESPGSVPGTTQQKNPVPAPTSIPVTPTPAPTSTTSAPAASLDNIQSITQYLSFGMLSPQVKLLQQFLIEEGYLAPDGATSYYGNNTREAVKLFQCHYGIVCGGDEQTTGYGAVTLKTREKINELISEKNNLY